MFLYNIFTGGSLSKQEESKSDKIAFKINLSDNIPQFYECTVDKIHEEEEIAPQHPLYQKIFGKGAAEKELHQRKQSEDQLGKKPEWPSDKEGETQGGGESEDIYIEYRTDENDTLFGLAIKLDISEKSIRDLNDIGGRLYPGMTIKLPSSIQLDKLQDKPIEDALTKIRISQLLGSEVSNVSTEKIEAEYYAGSVGYIKGSLNLNKNYLIFNPSLENQSNLINFSVQNLLKFNAIIETIDIQDILYMDIPEMSEDNSENPNHNHIIKVFLYTVGNNRLEKKYKERLKKLKVEEKAIASIEFSLRCHKQSACEDSKFLVEKVLKIIGELKENPKQESKKEQKRLTNIPFFDIIHENIHPKIKQEMEDISSPENKMSPSKMAVMGMLSEHSEIVTDNEFQNLVPKLPILYQLNNWNRIYSSTHNGSSFVTFLKKAKNEEPVLLLIKEYKGYSFGAFIIESLETGKTGRGQMFLFTFKGEEVPIIYKWTGKNEFFVYIEKESGIGIGMGLKYALFLRNTLDKGSSSSSFTFGNEEGLSKKEDFTIEQVELWTVDNANYWS